MTNKNMPTKSPNEMKMEELASDVRKQVENMAAELQKNMMQSFNSILTGDFKKLEGSINNILKDQQKRIMKQSENDIRSAIKKKFGSNIFGTILGDFIVPSVFDSYSQNSSRSGSFKGADGNLLSDLAGSMARSKVRNG